MEDNFKCCKCNTTYFISEYYVTYSHFGKEYMYKNNNSIVCNCCGEKLSYIDKECKISDENGKSFGFGKFDSMSPLEKQAYLRKRSREDAKKYKYRDQDREKTFYGE